MGGGYAPDGLANEALHWMVEKAESLGLEFDTNYLLHFTPCFNSVLHDSMTVTYKALGQHLRPVGRQPADGEVLHKSSIDRRSRAECDYHPENLERFLANSGPVTPASTTRVPTGTPCLPLP